MISESQVKQTKENTPTAKERKKTRSLMKKRKEFKTKKNDLQLRVEYAELCEMVLKYAR